jgi:CPA2 family monovalent cation:H+ antiporter-2
MHEGLSLISTIVAGLGLALIAGFIAVRLKMPALLGYLVAGVAVGPFTPGYVADPHMASQLAEIGVMLLMFGVGLHFSIEDLLSVRRIALPGAIVQIAVATASGMALAGFWGWSLGGAIVFGLALSVASTVVLLRALESLGTLESINGRIAIGWLVVEDLAMVLVLVLLPPLAQFLGAPAAGGGGAHGLWLSLAATVGKVSLFIVLMLLIGGRLFPWLIWQVARTGSRELFTLFVIAAAVGIAYGAALLFGVSFAIGAFFAGMVIRKSQLSFRAAAESLPLRDAFSVLFFVSVGMLLNPHILVERPLQVLGVLAIILLGKSAAAFLIVLVFRYPINTALTVSAGLAQIGEFSFILAATGKSLGLLPQEGQSLILAGAIISIGINPLVFRAILPVQNWLRAHSDFAAKYESAVDPLAALPGSVEPRHVTGHVVLAGYGRVGKRIAEKLAASGVPFVVTEQNRELVEKLRAEGIKAVAGESAEPAVLVQAHVARARALVIAIPDAFNARKMIETARTLNPGIELVVRTHSEEDFSFLRQENAGKVFLGEHELADNMSRYLLDRISDPGPVPSQART